MLRIFQLNLRWRIERESMKWKIFAICLHLSCTCHLFTHWISAMFFDSQENCVLIQLCSLKFFSFSEYAEVWRARLDWMLQQHLNLAWTLRIWFCSFIPCESDLLVDLMLRSWIACVSLSFEHQIACDESQLYRSVF